MTERNQVWKCEVCGNIVEVVHAGAGQLVCCGQPMVLMEPKYEEAGGYEKHLPVIEVDGDTYTVKVGSVEHPMIAEHWIEWIALDTEGGTFRRFLNPGEKPVAVFTTEEKVKQAREYCNLHGHWATKVQPTELQGSKTERNLLTVFAGESQARNRYDYFASQARRDGYVQISRIFLETAENEKEHAKRLFKFLSGGEVEVAAAFPAGAIGDTASNLKASAMGENHEHTTMYLGFTETADEEGFAQIAGVFRSIAVAEKQHEKRYLTLLANIENDRVFKRDGPVTWKCGNCGYIHEGAAAPETCPACAHPRAYFEPLGENY